ncbi:MAG TPA: hypothetical protein VLA04_03775 [Verrucomicrobiae bacterium]|nr:hypothetical protein [Verrucomicrobiae bacterium]
MKQTAKTSTASCAYTNIRLDPLSKAKLDWIRTFYASKGEEFSNSMILRRAIETLEDHLSQFCNGRAKKELELELMLTLSCCNNKADPFNGQYPWKNLGNRPIKTFGYYVPNPILARLNESDYLRSTRPINS